MSTEPKSTNLPFTARELSVIATAQRVWEGRWPGDTYYFTDTNDVPSWIRRALSGEPSPLQSSIALVDQLVQATERADAAERKCREYLVQVEDMARISTQAEDELERIRIGRDRDIAALQSQLSTERGARQAAEMKLANIEHVMGADHDRAVMAERERDCEMTRRKNAEDALVKAGKECAKLRGEIASWQEEHRLCQGERNKAEAELARVKAAHDCAKQPAWEDGPTWSDWSEMQAAQVRQVRGDWNEEQARATALEAELAELRAGIDKLASRAASKSSPGAEVAE